MKHIESILILLKKDFIDGKRDWQIMIVILMPLLLSLVMGFSLSQDSISLPNVAILSKDKTAEKLFPNILFKKRIMITDIKEGKKLLEKGKVHGIIIIPENLIEKPNKKLELKVILDDSSISKSMILKTMVKKILENHFKISLPITLTFEKYRGLSIKQKMLPMWILLGIFMIGLTILPKSISTEKENKTLDALLLTSVTERDFLFSKVLWGAILIFLNSIILLYLNEGVSGNWFYMISIILAGTLVSVTIGIFIALVSPSESVSSLLSTFILLIMIMSTSIGDLSDKAEKFICFLPSYHVSKGFKAALYQKDLSSIWINVLILLIWSLVFIFLNLFYLKKREN